MASADSVVITPEHNSKGEMTEQGEITNNELVSLVLFSVCRDTIFKLLQFVLKCLR